MGGEGDKLHRNSQVLTQTKELNRSMTRMRRGLQLSFTAVV